jgi:hypothetical protein
MESTSDPPEDGKEMRCMQTTLRLAPSSNRCITTLSFFSKNVYNAGNYGYMQHMKLHDLQVQYYCDHLYDYIDMLSESDRLVLGKHLLYKKEMTKLCDIVRSSHISERELWTLLGDQAIVPEKPHKEGSDYTRFQYTADFMVAHCDELITLIGSSNLSPEERSKMIRFISDFQEALDRKIDGLKSDLGKGGKRSIIMPKTPDRSLLEHYVSITCQSYRRMPSQCAQQTIKRVSDAYSSYLKANA